MSEVFRTGGLSVGAARVEAIVECGAVDLRAVVELGDNIESFFFFFVYCCGDV